MKDGKLFALQILKPKILRRHGSSVFTECYHCKKEIKEIISRVEDNRGKFCSKICQRNFKITDEHRNLICKSKLKMTIKEFQNLIYGNKLTNTRLSEKFNISIHQVERLHLIFKTNQYYDPESELIEKICINCEKKFYLKSYMLTGTRFNKGSFCSKNCKHIYQSKNSFNPESLSFDYKNYKFFEISKQIGNYSSLNHGERSKQFVNKDKVDHFFLSNGVNNESTAYFLGLMLTDGSVNIYNNKTYTVRLGLIDKQIIYDLSKILKYKLKVNVRKKDVEKGIPNEVYTLNITSKYLYHDLNCLGCIPNKTYLANYPNINHSLDRHFIRGVIDGDGCFHLKEKKSLKLSIVGNDKFIYGLMLRIKHHLNIEPATVFMEGKKDNYKMKSFARIAYGTTHSKKIRDWIYDDAKIYMKRKKDIAYTKYDVLTDLLGTQKIANVLSVSRHAISRFIINPNNKIKYKSRGPYRYIDNEFLDDFLDKFKIYVLASTDQYFNKKQKNIIKNINAEDFFR